MKKFNEVREHSLEEKLKASDPAGKYISDFVHSDNPKFAGKSKAKRIQMALAASYAAKGKSRNEEVEVVYEANIEPTSAKSRSHIGNLSHPVVNSVEHSGKQIGLITKQPSGEYHAHHSAAKLAHAQSGTFDSKDKAHQFIRNAHAKAIKSGTLSDRFMKNEEVEQVDEIDMSKTLDSFNKNRPAYAQAKIDTRSAAQRKAETDAKLASQKKPNNPVNIKPASKDDMNKQIAKSYSNHKPGQYVGDSVELDGDTINELSKNQVEEGVMKAVKNLVKKAGKALTGGSDEDQRKDLQRKMGVPQTGKKPMQK